MQTRFHKNMPQRTRTLACGCSRVSLLCEAGATVTKGAPMQVKYRIFKVQ